MGSATPSSEKRGSATHYANKKWVACSDTKAVFNTGNHETTHLYVTVHKYGPLD